MQKRGQLALFLIIGIAIIILTALALSLNKVISNKALFLIDVKEVDNYIKVCGEYITEETLNYIYLYGGYTTVNEIPKSKDDVACLVYKEGSLYKNKLPATNGYKDFLENEISEQLKLNLPSCLNLQEKFNEYNINAKSLQVNVDMPSYNQDSLKVYIIYPIEIEKGNIKEQLSTFNIRYKSSLNNIYKYVNIISGEEAGSLNNNQGFTNNRCDTIIEGIQIKCIDAIDLRKYNLIDPINQKEFSFGVCR